MTYTGNEKHDGKIRTRYRKSREKAEKKGEYQIKRWAVRRDEDGRAIRLGRPLSLQKHRPTWVKKVGDYDRQKRLVRIAQLIRQGHSSQQVVEICMKEFRLSKLQTRKYVRRVYEEFQKDYNPEKRHEILVDYLQKLLEAIRKCHAIGDMKAIEGLLRQYGEVAGLITPKSMQNAGVSITDSRQQLIQISDPRAAQLTLEKLEGMSTHDLLAHLLPEQLGRGRPEDEACRALPGGTSGVAGEQA